MKSYVLANRNGTEFVQSISNEEVTLTTNKWDAMVFSLDALEVAKLILLNVHDLTFFGMEVE